MPTNDSVLPFIETITVTSMLWWVFFAITIAFLIHAVVVAYHWYTFGSERSVSILSTIIYIGVGAGLLLLMAITLLTL